MKIILTPNLNAPYNLRTIFPAYNDSSRILDVDADGYLTDDELLQRTIDRWKAKGLIAANAVIYIVDDSALLDDDDFFDAWEWDDEIVVNMPKARGIHMDRIRRVRNAELVAKDITFMRAIEAGDTSAQSTIATQKQVLRDIPATFDITTGVTTPAQLKAKWPSELPARE